MIPFTNLPPSIPLAEQTPTVRLLLRIIEQQQTLTGQLQSQVKQLQLLSEQQQETILQQRTEIDALKAEVARLKKLPKSPKSVPAHCPKTTMMMDLVLQGKVKIRPAANRVSAKKS